MVLSSYFFEVWSLLSNELRVIPVGMESPFANKFLL